MRDGNSQFEDAEDGSLVKFRRSTRNKIKPTEWWKTTGFVAVVSQLFSKTELQTSNTSAAFPKNLDFWKLGIDREHDYLTHNDSWKLVKRVPDMHLLPWKYGVKVKNEKPKIHLVAVGCRQIHGLDYNEKFAPVVSLTTIRSVFALVAALDLEL